MTKVAARAGQTVLDVAREAGVPLEGACEGSLSCSTCHIIVKGGSRTFGALPAACEDEEDMLDVAIGRRARSRLGCCVTVTAAGPAADLCVVLPPCSDAELAEADPPRQAALRLHGRDVYDADLVPEVDTESRGLGDTQWAPTYLAP